ncbi:NADPH-dependent ferric siderophore reductase, contains FAD-binding and SIP domains [Streptomyces sp. 2112.3]|uniref:siderophore-interacting protein n=1 Tax=Streptomyces sp. 2112.3 TaxID=1881023 RepID=UPI00089B89B4|nr:siderophore-interacting protein [Streptomyces sp. 2112.3]SEF06324.1 NADPH-dependent ferric siderophore reductase, contains FAD-binding and SIP domains [Streptomyces sp. 2112.3]
MTTTVAPSTAPFRFFDVHVVRSRRLGPSMVRITFGGERLAELASGGRDQRFKLFLPQPHQDRPVFDDTGDDWYTAWRAQDPAERAVMRSYTIREQRHEPAEFDVDFALHGAGPDSAVTAGGPASRWAARARPGDRLTVLAPAVEDNGGVDFRPPAGTDWILLTGDETALPAIAGILSWLSPGTRAEVWLEIAHEDDRQRLSTFADADIRWLFRDEAAAGRGEPVLDALRTAELPEGTPYAWIAGEAGTVKAVRRHLVRERGIDRRAVKFTGYWRRGATEEDLIAELTAAAAATTAAGEN